MEVNDSMYKKAIRHLRKDSVMEALINRYGVLKWIKVSDNIFSNIVREIVSQQLSDKAAATIFKRFTSLFPDSSFNPQSLLEIANDQLRSSGMSATKAGYVKNAAQAVVDGTLDIGNLKNSSDKEVIEELVAIKGIGQWTAEMVLIFSLGRRDVFSIGDLGLRTAVSHLYSVDRDNHKEIIKISQQWKPYRSIASSYLWKSLD